MTIDWVNPEAPWPNLDRLEAVTQAAGFELKPRLPVYPEYLSEAWIDPELLSATVGRATDDGYADIPNTTRMS